MDGWMHLFIGGVFKDMQNATAAWNLSKGYCKKVKKKPDFQGSPEKTKDSTCALFIHLTLSEYFGHAWTYGMYHMSVILAFCVAPTPWYTACNACMQNLDVERVESRALIHPGHWRSLPPSSLCVVNYQHHMTIKGLINLDKRLHGQHPPAAGKQALQCPRFWYCKLFDVCVRVHVYAPWHQRTQHTSTTGALLLLKEFKKVLFTQSLVTI